MNSKSKENSVIKIAFTGGGTGGHIILDLPLLIPCAKNSMTVEKLFRFTGLVILPEWTKPLLKKI